MLRVTHVQRPVDANEVIMLKIQSLSIDFVNFPMFVHLTWLTTLNMHRYFAQTEDNSASLLSWDVSSRRWQQNIVFNPWQAADIDKWCSGCGDWSEEKWIWQLLKQTLFVCTSVVLAGISFSSDPAGWVILCYLLFHTFLSSLQVFTKNGLRNK